MTNKKAKANIKGMRQQTQYTCMATSLTSVLRYYGRDVDEQDVNRVLGAIAKKGARWEEALATAQYFGLRGQLVVPATLNMVKEWTDKGVPVMIAWNPEDRPWSHASVISDVSDEGIVQIMDPNIPDPEKTFRFVPKDEFYKKWGEDWGDLIVRRPAMALTLEVDSTGRQVIASAQQGLTSPLSLRKDYGGIPQSNNASQLPSAGEKEEPDKGRTLGVKSEEAQDIYRNVEGDRAMSNKYAMTMEDLNRSLEGEFNRQLEARNKEDKKMSLSELPEELQENAKETEKTDKIPKNASPKRKRMEERPVLRTKTGPPQPTNKNASQLYMEKVSAFHKAAEELASAQETLKEEYDKTGSYDLEKLLHSERYPFEHSLRVACEVLSMWKDDISD